MPERVEHYQRVQRGSTSKSRSRVKRKVYRPPTIDPETGVLRRREDRFEHAESIPLSPASESTVVTRPTEKVYFPAAEELVVNTSNLTGDDTHKIDGNNTTWRSPTSQNEISAPDYHRMDYDIRRPSPKHRAKLNQWYQKHPALSKSASPSTADRQSPLTLASTTLSGTLMSLSSTLSSAFSRDTGTASATEDTANDTTLYTPEYSSTDHTMSIDETLVHDESKDVYSLAENDYLKTKQQVAYMSIAVTAAQLLILTIQLALCGFAPIEVNPMVGPFPDAFSEWGGKNAYLLLREKEWWRLITPTFLHVGVLHLLANAFCQLGAVAFFEREWGSLRWMIIYLISTVGCTTFSCYFDPDTIAVGSSGALMGLYAAKLAQVMSHTCFDVNKANNDDDVIRLDQLSGVLCGLAVVSLFSAFTYIDWSGHMGGLATGFASGMILFSNPIRSCCVRFLWILLGLASLAAPLGFLTYDFVENGDPDEELGDACDYFRNLFPEGYYCGCT